MAQGESLVIAKAGAPVARLIPYQPDEAVAQRRLGFLEGQFAVPDDFDRIASQNAGEVAR